jgi:hypothetical protein
VKVSVLVIASVSALVGCGGPDAPRSREEREEPDLPLVAREPRDEAPSRPPRLRGSPPAAPAPLPPRPRWTGKTIDLDVKDADLHNVFRLLAEVGNVSIVVADDVEGAVTLRLRSVPWDQALDTVIRMEQLSLRRDGTVYTITRASSSSSASPSASAPPPPPP